MVCLFQAIVLNIKEFYHLFFSLSHRKKGQTKCIALVSFFKDIDNIFDMVSQWGYMLYAIDDLFIRHSHNKPQWVDDVHLLVLGSVILRGISSLLYCFDETRYQVCLIKTVILDMIYFLLILFSSLFYFAMLLLKVDFANIVKKQT